MPITTDTLRDQRRLNLVFAVCGLAFLVTTVWMMWEDHNARWKDYQGDFQSNVALMAELELDRYESPDYQRQIEAAEQRVQDLTAALERDQEYQKLSSDLYEAEQTLQGANFDFNDAKAVLDVRNQEYERAVLAHGAGSPEAAEARQNRAAQAELVSRTAARREELEDRIAGLRDTLKEKSEKRDDAQKTLAGLVRDRDAARKRKELNEDSFVNMLRNGPLDFAVRTREVKGGYVPGVKEQLNFMTFPRIDRCQTCHIAIDDKRFTEEELVVDLAMSIAGINSTRRLEGFQPAPLTPIRRGDGDSVEQDFVLVRGVDGADAAGDAERSRIEPVKAAEEESGSSGDESQEKRPAISGRILVAAPAAGAGTNGHTESEGTNGHSESSGNIRTSRTNGEESPDPNLPSPGLQAGLPAAGEPVAGVWVLLLSDRQLVNAVRTDAQGQYAFPEAPPGNYDLTVRNRDEIILPFLLPEVPRYDAEGRLIPEEEYLAAVADLDADRERFIRDLWDRLTLTGQDDRRAQIYQQVLDATNRYRESEGKAPLQLTQPLMAHPNLDLYVSPDSKHPIKSMGCTVCHGGNGDETSFVTAIHTASTPAEQAEWDARYKERIDPSMARHWWNRPMLQKKYLEASCLKCHDGAADVALHENRDLATQITEGRRLFTQTGCINCHKVADLDDSRKVGPDLTHVADKLSPEFMQAWIWYPRDFRPSTWMPHFFKQENNYVASGLHNDPDPNPRLRTETEVAAMTHWLVSFSTPYEPEPAPEGMKPDAERGRVLFDSVGCLACHAALDHKRPGHDETLGVEWIAADLHHREKVDALRAVSRAKGMTYGEQVRYAMEHFPQERRKRAQELKEHLQWEQRKAQLDQDAKRADEIGKRIEEMFIPPEFTRFAPELSGIGSKVAIGWLYDWLREPRHYHSYTKMPSLRLTEQEALDIAGYLVTLTEDDFEPHAFEMNEARTKMADDLILTLLEGQNSKRMAQAILDDEGGRLTQMLDKLLEKTMPDESQRRAKLEALGPQGRKLAFLGNKMINHYGCGSCHTIPGFETVQRPGTELTEWAEKPLNKLDFAFFEHVFHHDRGEDFDWLYPPEGVTYGAGAPGGHGSDRADHDARDADPFAHLRRDGGQKQLHPMHSNAWFAWTKVRNPRIFDRAKLKGPYEKLKMPNFYFTNAEADALTTYLMSREQSLVEPSLKPDAGTQLPDIARGRNLTTELNCIGCHRIENNAATLHQYVVAGMQDVSTTTEEEAGGEWDEWGGSGGEGQEQAAQPAEDEWDWGGDAGGAQQPAEKALSPEEIAAINIVKAGAGADYDEINGPPWLRGEGAKVQPSWLDDFLHNVVTLRPWLRMRMPSFHLTNEQSTDLVRYFAGLSKREADVLRRHLEPVLKNMDKAAAAAAEKNEPLPEGRTPGDEWYRDPSLKAQARFLAMYNMDNKLMLPLDFHAPPGSNKLAASYLEAARRAAFIADLYDISFPFDGQPRGYVDAERFDRGREMTIEVLDCLACHALGDPNVPGANKNPSAPNLNLTYKRLRRNWVHQWLQEPAYIQPGTKMPQWFPGGHSAFRDFGDERETFEARFGKSGEEQMQLLMDFLYEAGERAYTGVKGGTPPSASDSAAEEKPQQ